MKRLVAIAMLLVLASVMAPARAADVFAGQRIYRAHCVGCHGIRGRPELPGAPNFARGDGLMRSDLAIMNAVAEGKGAMPGYRGVLTDEEILDVVAYLRTLR